MSVSGGEGHRVYFNGMEDDDSEVVKAALMPHLKWEDAKHQRQCLKALNRMRKNKQFCDVTLRVSVFFLLVRPLTCFLTQFSPTFRLDNMTLPVTVSFWPLLPLTLWN